RLMPGRRVFVCGKFRRVRCGQGRAVDFTRVLESSFTGRGRTTQRVLASWFAGRWLKWSLVTYGCHIRHSEFVILAVMWITPSPLAYGRVYPTNRCSTRP